MQAVGEPELRDGTLDALLLRSAIPLGPRVPSIDSHLACAALCAAEGLVGPARLLYAIAFVRQGFSVQHRAARAGVARGFGWDEFAGETDRPAGATVDVAIAETAALARCIGDRIAARGLAGDRGPTGGVAIHGALGDLGEAIEQLYAILRAPVAAEPDETDALLARLGAAARAAESFDYRAFHAAPLPLLAEAMAFAGLQEYLLANDDLIFANAGCAALLHAVARFDSAGLGPYLANVGRIAAGSNDIFALAEIAVEASGAGTGRQAWIALLSRLLKGALLKEVVDDLGDLGDMGVLAAIFDRAARWPNDRVDIPLILRLRDAALDNGDWEFAVRTQARVVRARPAEVLERVILGSIEATAGMIAAAEQTFLDCLSEHPGYGDTAERLQALRADDFARFKVRSGYGSPKDRALFRQRRREGVSLSQTMRRAHSVAVEL